MVAIHFVQSGLGENRWLWFSTLTLLLAFASHAATSVWSGGGSDANWSNGGNWTGGTPSPATDVLFFTNGAVTTSVSNNTVSANLTVQSLTFSHTNPATGTQFFHNTFVADGVTLTVSNALAANALFTGSGLALVNTKTTATISGANGALVVNAPNGAVNVRQGGIQNFSGLATLDLSALGSCTVRAARLLVAGDGSNGVAERDRATGLLKLARNNLLILDGGAFPPALTVGRNIGNGGSGAGLVLGQTNFIFADTGLAVGMGRNAPCTLGFGGFSNALAVFRGSDGGGRQNAWLIGDCLSVNYSGNTNSGNADFSGGTVDALVSLAVVGRSVNDNKGFAFGGTEGVLTFNAGALDVNTLVIGQQMNTNCARVGGTVNVDGPARLLVNNAVQLGKFFPSDPTNGASYAVLNIGTRSGGGSVIVNGGISTTPSSGSTNDSEIIIRNGGSLAVKNTLGPLFKLELNNASLALDFGTATNSAAPFCYVTNFTVASPVALTVAGTRLTNGQVTLFKYKNVSGAGFAGITSLTFSNGLGGFLSNNVANSSVDLVLTASSPNTNPPPVVTPRLNSAPPVYADYAKVLNESASRADGYTHVDTPAMIAKLQSGNIKTYAYLCWMTKTEWDDLRLEFLPAAQAAGINVYLYLTPPTENNPPGAYVPFGDDYYSWLTGAAALSVKFSVLKAVVMDDFNSNLGVFTPDYVRRITDAAHTVNSNLLFMVINYDLSKGWASPTSYTSPAFINSYGAYLGAVMFAYLNWATNSDFTSESNQLAHNSGIIRGRLAQFLVNFPSSKPTSAGNYAAVSQVLSNNGAVFPNAPYPFTFRVSGYPSTATSGYHQLQVLVDGSVVWSRDIANAYGVQDVTTNLQAWLAGKTSATLTCRVYDTAGVTSFFIRPSWILPGGAWVQTETGGFVGTSTYYPALSNNVPMLTMLYDWQYSVGGNNTSNYIYNANVIAQNSVLAGEAAGIIQFELDKAAGSPLFPIIQQLYGQWAYQPQFNFIQRQPDGSVMVRGNGGGPNIGYTLRAAANLSVPSVAWVTLVTNNFSSDGSFTNTDSTASGQPNRFYRISVP